MSDELTVKEEHEGVGDHPDAHTEPLHLSTR
jgi:hypothetical protein